MYTVVKLATLDKKQVEEIVAEAASALSALPTRINDSEAQYVDPSFQVIRVRLNGRELVSGLEFPDEATDTEELRRFRSAWETLTQRLRSHGVRR